MGKATGNEELALILFAQFDHDVLAESGTGLADIDCHIEHTTLDDTYELGLGGVALLVMQATKYAKRRLRLVVLDELDLTYMLVELGLFPSLHEIASGIIEHLGFNNKNTLNICLDIFHSLKFCAKVRQKID